MPKTTITLKKAVMCAEMALVLHRQAFKFDASMYDRGVFNQKTQNAKAKYEQITAAIALLKSLVAPVNPRGQQDPVTTTSPRFEGK